MPAGLAGRSWGGCTQAHAGKGPIPSCPIPPPPTYLCVASVRTTEESSCPSLADTCMTYCGQLPAGPPLPLPPGRVLLLGAGGRSGGTPGRWLQWLVLMAVGGGSPSREEGGQGGGMGGRGTSLPACKSAARISTRREKKHPPLPAPALQNVLSRERKLITLCVAEKQSVRLRNSKPGLCAAFFPLQTPKVASDKRRDWTFLSLPPQMLQRNIQSLPCELLNLKSCLCPPKGKVMYWRRKWLVSSKSPGKTPLLLSAFHHQPTAEHGPGK